MNIYSVDQAGGRPAFRTYVLLFRVLSWAVAFLYLSQAVLAGQFLSGTYPALRLHQIGATTSDAVLFAAVAVAALLRWHAKSRSWPFWTALGLLVTNQIQNGAGAARWVHLHIPLGALMLATAVLLAVAATRTHLHPGSRTDDQGARQASDELPAQATLPAHSEEAS